MARIRSFLGTPLGRRSPSIDAHVVLTVEKLEQRAEATVHISGAEVFADANCDDMYAAIDKLTDKLDRQILKHKEKLQARHHGR